jgi:hypothetical protein
MVGISKNFLSGALPLNGLRYLQEGQSCGWFLWAGEELSEAPDFFEVCHAHHLVDRRPDGKVSWSSPWMAISNS